MVLPEGTPPSGTARPRRLAVLGIIVLLMLAVVAVGLATAPSEEAAPQTTTTTTIDEPLARPTTTTTIDPETFSVGDIATGERLSWREAPSIGLRWPIELLEHRGQILLFTSGAGGDPRAVSKGMEVWVSDSGIQWHHMGEVAGPGYSITSVKSAGNDLVALGRHVDDGSPHVWISPDGMEWSRSDLPLVELEPGSPTIAWLGGAAQLGDQLVVTGTAHTDTTSEILERLPPEIGDLASRYGMGLSEGPDGGTIELYGPMGIVGYSATLEELGIDQETANRYFHGSAADQSYAWMSSDGNDWTIVEMGNSFIESLWSMTEETLVGSGWDNFGPSVWSSTDGLSWERVDTYETVVADEWGGSLFGTRNDRELVRSNDGHNWDSLGTDAILPAGINWSLGPVEAGPRGIAVIATAWLPRMREPTTEVSHFVDGHTITMDQRTGELTVQDGSGRTVTVPLWSHETQDLLALDLEDQEVTFLDPDTGAETVTVDFATLHEMEVASYGRPDFGQGALLLGDGNNQWSILDLSEEIGDEEVVAMMRMFEDRLILITHPASAWSTSGVPAISIRVTTLR